MNKKHILLLIWLTALVTMVVSAPISAEVSVGVSESDWIEYTVTHTGTPPGD